MSALDRERENSVVEQALRDGELHKALLDHLEAGIYMVDRRRRILYWNRGAEQISGFLSQDVAGHFCQGDLLMHCDSAGRGMCGKAALCQPSCWTASRTSTIFSCGTGRGIAFPYTCGRDPSWTQPAPSSGRSRFSSHARFRRRSTAERSTNTDVWTHWPRWPIVSTGSSG
jgi:PAS domain-containing protein